MKENDFKTITELIAKARYNALKSVNKELISLYWNIGHYISEKIESSEWGKSIVEKLSEYINNQFVDIKGFSSSNLWRMKQFYENYCRNEKLATLLREISWAAHIDIMTKAKTLEEKEFYILLAIKEKLSVRELRRQIQSCVYERTMLADTKMPTKLVEFPKDLTGIFKDTYIFEFLNLPKILTKKICNTH